jgi:hypothetical protein
MTVEDEKAIARIIIIIRPSAAITNIGKAMAIVAIIIAVIGIIGVAAIAVISRIGIFGTKTRIASRQCQAQCQQDGEITTGRPGISSKKFQHVATIFFTKIAGKISVK